MKQTIGRLLLLGTLAFAGAASSAYGYSCDSDCGREAEFRYRCPTFRKPGRMCTGKNQAKYAACEADKAVSCRLWNSATAFFTPKVKPYLQGRYNASTYNPDRQSEYILECTSAAVAVMGAIGSAYGPPYGTLAGGAAGFFVGKRICIQSTTW